MRTIAFYDLGFPDEKSPFRDLRVRQAVAHAIDYKGITKYVLHGTAEPVADILPPYGIGFDPSIKGYEYNIKKAKALLKEAGYPNGFDTVLHSENPVKDETEAIAASLKKAGIRAKVNIAEHATRDRKVFEKKFRALGNMPGPWWSGYVHPGLALGSHLGRESLWTYYNDRDLLELMDKLSIMTDEKGLEKLAREISKKYRERLIRAPLWAYHIPYVYGPRVKYWANVPGHIFGSQYEFLELK